MRGSEEEVVAKSVYL